MAIANNQNEVFVRSGRIEIPMAFIKQEVKPGLIGFNGLIHGEWSKSITKASLKTAALHVDIRSSLFWERTSVDSALKSFDAGWKGCLVKVPVELTAGDHRVKMQVTISLPEGGKDSGYIFAKSSEIVVVEGPTSDKGNKGSSLLPTRAANESIPELWRLVIEPKGPVLEINKDVAELSWRELVADPRFKLAVFPPVLRHILHFLVRNPAERSTWGTRWLELEGIKGRDIPEFDEDKEFADYMEEVEDYIENAANGFLLQVEIPKKFGDSLKKIRGAS
jgi:hypothetical protein